MSQQEFSPKFIIQSKNDTQKFAVDKNVIESSTLLKNICEITSVTEPIIVNCESNSLKFYITLIKNYQKSDDKEAVKTLFNSATDNNKQKLIKLIQDLCILDSDIFLNSAADYILAKIEDSEERRDWRDIQKYLGLENDFNQKERKLMLESEKLEYFLSIDTGNFKFPFPNKALYSLKTDFSTPMNILIARIIQRSNAKTSRLLSLINKTVKNEVDRHPFKLTEFRGTNDCWYLNIYLKKLRSGLIAYLNCKKYDEKYFNVLKQRKVIAENFSITFFNGEVWEEQIFKCNSINFPISKSMKVVFSGTYKLMYQFDTTKYQSSSICYDLRTFEENGIKFGEIYNHLIAKDLSKEIELQFSEDIFNFFCSHAFFRFYKKQNASKFYKLEIYPSENHIKFNPEFKAFITKYMEDDGIIQSPKRILGIPEKIDKIEGNFNYPVSIVKKYFENYLKIDCCCEIYE